MTNAVAFPHPGCGIIHTIQMHFSQFLCVGLKIDILNGCQSIFITSTKGSPSLSVYEREILEMLTHLSFRNSVIEFDTSKRGLKKFIIPFSALHSISRVPYLTGMKSIISSCMVGLFRSCQDVWNGIELCNREGRSLDSFEATREFFNINPPCTIPAFSFLFFLVYALVGVSLCSSVCKCPSSSISHLIDNLQMLRPSHTAGKYRNGTEIRFKLQNSQIEQEKTDEKQSYVETEIYGVRSWKTDSKHNFLTFSSPFLKYILYDFPDFEEKIPFPVMTGEMQFDTKFHIYL
eukprot:gnl/Carplike_NY0171/14673_a21740_95.p1 GENE.gnl/Carplike_NY0171/14673_a21740_95~~gnl/Carplike_NY0171/14673_a21740_95.p1  ORF type:complete len:308 (+),score=48.45 gnl/Carplike_NY0171/14673_a21740_95:57-926(+)